MKKLFVIAVVLIAIFGLTWFEVAAQDIPPLPTPVATERIHNLPHIEVTSAEGISVLVPYIEVHVCRSIFWIFIDDCDSAFVRPAVGVNVDFEHLDGDAIVVRTTNDDGVATYEDVYPLGNWFVSPEEEGVWTIVSVHQDTGVRIDFVLPPNLYLPFVSRYIQQ